MATKIDEKIVGASIVGKSAEKEATQTEKAPPLKRPYVLTGSTYKIKPPISGWRSIYITVNADENGRPFEVFLTTKGLENRQWLDTIALLLSATLRREDATFLLDVMKGTPGPTSYFMGGRNYPSVIAHIGWVIDECINGKTPTKKDMMGVSVGDKEIEKSGGGNEIKATGTECPECHEMTLIKDGGCTRCTNENCGYLGECG